MSSHKGHSHPKKKHRGHSRRHRRKHNLEKKWNPKHFLKSEIFQRKESPFYIPPLSQDYFRDKNHIPELSTSYTSFPNQQYNNQGQQPFSAF